MENDTFTGLRSEKAFRHADCHFCLVRSAVSSLSIPRNPISLICLRFRGSSREELYASFPTQNLSPTLNKLQSANKGVIPWPRYHKSQSNGTPAMLRNYRVITIILVKQCRPYRGRRVGRQLHLCQAPRLLGLRVALGRFRLSLFLYH